jgi:hypothetical protein
MKTASISELKQELVNFTQQELCEICLRLAKFKKENKELLTYLLFEENDLQGYIENVKSEIDAQFAGLNTSHLYFAKKTLRKILRIAGKHIRYTGSKQAEAELLIHFCLRLKNAGISFENSPVLVNLYQHQIKKINATIATMHEDLQYDYIKALNALA